MAQVSLDEFLKMQEAREAQRTLNAQSQKSRVSFFGLKDDGDEAVIRFACDPEEFEIRTVHPVTVDGKFRKVNCINDIKTGVHTCPLCEAGVQLQNKFYIRLIEYTRDENGNIVPEAKVWERPTSYVQRLMNLYSEYGSLKNNIFKVKRNGVRGNMKTDYTFMFGNPTIYNEQLYPKDFSAFDGYTALGSAILDKTAEEMREYIPHDQGQILTPQVVLDSGQLAGAQSITPGWTSAASGTISPVNTQPPVTPGSVAPQSQFSDQPRRSQVMYQ